MLPHLVLLSLLAAGIPVGAALAATADAAPGDVRVAADDVLLEVSADTDAPYVQARVRYRVRVLARVPLRDATLSAPTADGALLRRVGSDRRFDLEQSGQRYRASERLYVVVPEQPGPLTIAGPTLSAAVPERALEGAPADALIERRVVLSRTAPDLVLQVRPPPTTAAHAWLPAESVSISERWQPEPDRLRVGDPLQRRIVIEAAGVGASALPLPATPAVPGLRVYPQRAEHDQRQIGEDLAVTTVLEQTLVPTTPGILSLPAVQVPWWSLGMDEARIASLPARQLVVTGSTVGAPPTRDTAAADTGWRERFLARAGADLWGPSGLALALGLAWLVTLFLWWRERRRRGRAGQGERPRVLAAAIPVEEWVRRFRRACERDDAAAAREALAGWAAAVQRSRGVGRLGTATLLREQGAADAALAVVRELDQRLWGRHDASNPWRGGEALGLLLPLLREAGAAEAQAAADRAGLPALFPVRGGDG
ncbi:hypothetical protein [uncultured Thiohalocapsa sp.]|uniref:BatD family protein n=1 Tax=uncultured Thiohalocapsa sp. TaxID=768990 RepID=UPI0025FC3B7B|nr:hypothetical protein [uncultured Thiohalocapsa sp.]